MMKKVMIAGLWALFLIPNLLFPSVEGSSQIDTGGNRNLVESPVFLPDTYEAYPTAVDSYTNDHTAFRNLFLSVSSMINLKLFGYTNSQGAIMGKDGQYFFAGDMSLCDTLGAQPSYPDDAAWIGGQIIKAAGYYESRGIPFLMVIVPNEEGIYREYMPNVHKRTWDGNRPGQLEDYIRKRSDAVILGPREHFNASWDYVWYYKTDMHRSSAGGYAARQMFIEVLRGTPVLVEGVQVDCIKGTPGGLANLFHLPKKYCDDQIVLTSGYHKDLEATMQDVNDDKNIAHTSIPEASGKRRIAVIRNSLGIAPMDFLPRYFTSVNFYHWQAPDRSLLEENPPDAVVYLIMERNLARIPQGMGKMVLGE